MIIRHNSIKILIPTIYIYDQKMGVQFIILVAKKFPLIRFQSITLSVTTDTIMWVIFLYIIPMSNYLANCVYDDI